MILLILIHGNLWNRVWKHIGKTVSYRINIAFGFALSIDYI